MKDLAKLASDAGLTVLLDGKIGRQEYQSITGSFAALERFAMAFYEPAGDNKSLIESLLNRAALQIDDNDASVMREAAGVLTREHYVGMARKAAALTYPDELTADLREVLGWPNFRCGPIAHLMRAAGADIKRKAEDEQAVVLHWMVKLVLQHGADWWTVGTKEISAMQERIKPTPSKEIPEVHND
ncbi:hypothetical protein Q8F57_003420 [Paraburkholderia terrae]|uniref:hypothetical protein n=1 Tax=Paraburkholderia terrae TaxID=311230 RepID=UPI00296AE621|nr:hypothetical protein [Paraburkholderia terrae]MDW3655424.1 hypothetical protein [Paraburkholderia terrae]